MKGVHPFNLPHLTKGGGKVLKRGADASLIPPALLTTEQRMSKRGFTSLIYSFPLPLDKGKGDKGGWGYLIKPKGG